MLKILEAIEKQRRAGGQSSPRDVQRTGQVVNDALHAAGETNDETGEPISAEA